MISHVQNCVDGTKMKEGSIHTTGSALKYRAELQKPLTFSQRAVHARKAAKQISVAAEKREVHVGQDASVKVTKM